MILCTSAFFIEPVKSTVDVCIDEHFYENQDKSRSYSGLKRSSRKSINHLDLSIKYHFVPAMYHRFLDKDHSLLPTYFSMCMHSFCFRLKVGT
jgi:hypothetical protein